MAIAIDTSTKGENNNASTQASGSVATTTTDTFLGIVLGQGTQSLTDNEGNTPYVSAGSQNFNGANGKSTCLYFQNATGGAGTIWTGGQTGGAGPCFAVVALSGAALSGGLHAFNSSNPSGGGGAIAAPSVVTTLPNCMILTFIGGASNNLATPTSASGTVLTPTVFSTNAVGLCGAFSWFLAATAGTYNDSLTFPGQTFDDVCAYTIALAPSGGGGSNTASIAWTT